MALIASILSKFDDSGIRKAKSGFSGLKKTIGALGIGLSLAALTDSLVEVTKAASADQKSMQLLNNQLRKNAGATEAQVKQNDKFIDSLSQQVGIVDDNLRPAMGKLVRATGSVTKAQDLLQLALDASAVSGKPLDTVAQALSKAYNGNTTALTRMFPELKKSKNAIADLRKEVEGAAAQQADPFAKFNVSMDNIQEKIGYMILPMLTKFLDFIAKPGGLGDQVGKFIDDLGNPKTDVGAFWAQNVLPIFQSIGDLFASLIGFSKTFFASGAGSTLIATLKVVLGTINFIIEAVTEAIKLLEEMLGLKTASENASSNKVTGLSFTGGKDLNTTGTKFQPTGEVFSFGSISGQNTIVSRSGSGANPITINVQGADPKAVVDAVSKYAKQNGGLPSSWNAYGTTR